MKMIVSTALTEVPVNVMPLVSDSDFKTVQESVAYNASGMDLVWNFVTTAGVFTQTAVTPTTAGAYDWTNQGNGMYSIEIPASGGASINNNASGYGWFTGVATGVLPWRGPVIEFVDAVSPWDALVADYDTAGTFGALVMKTTDTITIDNTALDDMWSRWMNTATSDTGAGEVGRALHYIASSFASSGVFSEAALANAAGGSAAIDREAADMIAARVNAHRGDFYPNANQVWVLRRGTSGLEVKNSFQISKGAGETLRVYIDFASVMGRNEFVESIEALTLSGGTATIVADSEGITGNLVYFDVTGGAADDTATVEFEVLSTEDQTIAGDVCEFNVVE